MRRDTVELVTKAVAENQRAYEMVNNRSEGHAPLTVHAVQMPSSISFFLDQFHSSHVWPQYLRYPDAPIRLLVLFEDGHECTADGKS